jgi:two-component system cell cycle sensor histidine kinase PleC
VFQDVQTSHSAASLSGIEQMVRRGFRTVGCSVWPDKADAWLACARLDLYWSTTRYNMLLMPVAAALVAQAVAPWVDARARLLWWSTVTFASLGCNLGSYLVQRLCPATAAGERLRSVIFVALNTLFFCAWCSMSAVLWVPGAVVDHMMLILVLACSLAGCIAITAPHPAIALSAFLVHAAFLVGPTSASNDASDRTLAELAALFVILVLGQSIALNVRMTRMLVLEHERTGLVQDLRLAKEESDRAQARAAEAGEARSQFLSHMNHELRTPMNAILGFSEMIQSKAFGGAVEKYAAYAAIIHDSGQRLLTLINGVLDLARIEGGRLSLREIELDLSQLIRAIAEQYEAKAADAQVSLTISPGNALRIRGDERALQQILGHLLSNAIKFTPADGRINVFGRVQSDGRIAFGVVDSGIGVAREDQGNVFERFGRGRHDVTTGERGTGLGLAIVKGFAEAHGGEVRLESKLGAGTRVTVYLPGERIVGPPCLAATA